MVGEVIEEEPLTVESSPSRLEVCFLWVLVAALFVGVLTRFQTYTRVVDHFGDNGSYLQASDAIRHWDFRGIEVKQFWGLSYLIAGIS